MVQLPSILQSVNIVNGTNYMFLVLISISEHALPMYFKQMGIVFVYKNRSTMICLVLFRLYEKLFLKNRTISRMHHDACSGRFVFYIEQHIFWNPHDIHHTCKLGC